MRQRVITRTANATQAKLQRAFGNPTISHNKTRAKGAASHLRFN